MLGKILFKYISVMIFSSIYTFSSVNAADNELLNLDITTSFPAIIALVVFALAYILVMAEEYTHLRKSKPVIVAAGFIWGVVAFMAMKMGYDNHSASYAFKHTFLEFAELFAFLLVAMTFINYNMYNWSFIYRQPCSIKVKWRSTIIYFHSQNICIKVFSFL